MCRVLDVSVSGYYAWRTRPICARKREDGELTTQIVQTFTTHRGVYGSPRIHAHLRAQGIGCGRKRVIRLMQQARLCAHHRTHRAITTQRDPQARVAQNVLARDFSAPRPNVKWVTDITFIPTREGWLYLAVVLDLFSRMVVGWSMAAAPDESLVASALHMAFTRREPHADLLHHSDQGCQYTSTAYLALLENRGIQVSMSRTGNCYDNAVMERFFGTLKRECPMAFETRQQARSAIFEYIEVFYNRVRLHSTLDYASPADFEVSKS